MWALATVLVFVAARYLYNKARTPLLNPLVVSVTVLICVLSLFSLPYGDYAADNQIFVLLLQPAIVALALPLYEQLPQIRSNWKLIILACALSSFSSMLMALFIALLFQVELAWLANLLGKSVTTPIAMTLAEQHGGEPAIAAVLVMVAGIFGALCAYPIFNLLNIKHPMARGLTMGSVSHAIGTAVSAEHNSQDGAFSSLALILCAVFTAVIAPLAYSLAQWLSLTVFH